MASLKSTSVVKIFLAFGLCLFGMNCAANQSHQSEIDHAKGLLNQRKYEDAAALLESLSVRDGGEVSTNTLLIEAHMGAAGFKLLDFMSAVAKPQTEADRNGSDATLEAAAQVHCPTGAIADVGSLDFRCMILRLLKDLPKVEDPHFLRAQAILRREFPDPETSDASINSLGVFLEIGSAVARMQTLALSGAAATSSQAPATADVFLHHLKRMLMELKFGFARAKFADSRIQGYFAGVANAQRVKIAGESHGIEELTPDLLLRWAADVAARAVKVPVAVTDEALALADPIGNVVHQFDAIWPGSRMSQVGLSVNGFANLLALAHHSDPHALGEKLVEAMWKNPPRLLRDLLAAFNQSWDQESSAALVQYFGHAQAEWNALDTIVADFATWSAAHPERLSKIHGLAAEIAELSDVSPSFPDEAQSDDEGAWFDDTLNYGIRVIDAVIDAQHAAATVAADTELKAIYQRTQEWSKRNFW